MSEPTQSRMNSELTWSALRQSRAVRVALIVAAAPLATLLILAFTIKMPEPVLSLLIFATALCWPMLTFVCGRVVGKYARSGICLACGYDVRDLDDSAVCPECGRAVSESREYASPDPPVAAAHRRTLARSVLTIVAVSAVISIVPAIAGGFAQSIWFPVIMATGFSYIAHTCCSVGAEAFHATRLGPDEPRWTPPPRTPAA